MTFEELYLGIRKSQALKAFKVLAFDPGETTGVCLLVCESGVIKPTIQGQLNTQDVLQGSKELRQMLATNPSFVVFEDYKVYGWKAKTHAWSELHTPRLIGALEFLLGDSNIPYTKQSAQQGKSFCTDEKLKEWGFYKAGLKHSMDATRHACQAVLFNKHPYFIGKE